MVLFLDALLVRGLGAFLLVVVCAVLFGFRRSPHFLYWTLAWSCFIVVLLGGLDVSEPAGQGLPEARPWLDAVAVVAAGWQLAFWIFGLARFQRERQVNDEGQHHYEGSAKAAWFPPPFLVTLLLVALAAAAGARLLPWTAQAVLLAGGRLLVYGASAFLLARLDRRPGQTSVLLLTVALVALAVEQIPYLLGFLFFLPGDPNFLQLFAILSLVEFLIETFLAGGLVVMLLRDTDKILRHTQRLLAESEDHFRLMFEHNGVGMALLTPEGKFLRVNPALTRFLGYSVEELHGKRLVDLAHPEDTRNGISPSEQGIGLPLDMYERERRYLRKNGQSVWARVVRVPLRDMAGELRYLVGVVLDITERRLAEEALAASEQRYRRRFQEAFEGVYSCAETGEFLDANPAFCRMLGYTAEEIQNLALADLSEDLVQVRRHIATVLAQGGDRCETKLRGKDGRVVDVEISTALVETDNRRVLHSISRDISLRKRSEEAIRHAEEVVRQERDFSNQVLQTADALIVVLDAAGRIVRFNGKCSELSGYLEDEVRGRVFWEFLLPHSTIASVRANFSRLVKEQVPFMVENAWVTRSGEERLIAWRNTTVRDRQGRLLYVIGTGLDITDQRRLEEQLRQAQKMETVGRLVGGIAHDFNNQLTAILGNLGLVLGNLNPEDPGFPELLDAERAAQRCADMIQGLLTFSRRRVSRMQLVNLNQVMAEVVRLLQRLLPATIRIEMNLDPDLGMTLADNTQLHQLAMNLAVNARDAMQQGGTLILTTANQVVSAADCSHQGNARPGRYVVLSVQDSGNGMTPEVQARIFEPFFTTKEVGQGTGLGLSMVFGIVQAHRGWITVVSEPGQGSTFRIFLPAAEDAIPESTPDSHRPAARGGRECILVVDDETLVRNLTRSVLERWGFRVLTAANGEEALATYRSRAADIDLVLLDITMPRLTGLQVLETLQQLNPSVRVIFSSGQAMYADSDRLLAAGAHAFLAKPFRPDDLVHRIRHVLDEGAPPGIN